MTTPWTEKGTRAKCRRKLDAIRKQVTTMAGDVAYEWGDVDEHVVGCCDGLIKVVEDAIKEVEEAMDDRVAMAEGTGDYAPDEERIDPSKKYVSIEQVAEIGKVTRKHVRRQITRAEAGRAWMGAEMRAVIPRGGDVLIEFATLPEHIREAFVMLDQTTLQI